ILGREVGADVVFECAGNPASLANCISCVKPGGMVEVIGTIQEPLSNLVPGGFSISEPTLDFSFVYTPDEVEIYLDMLAAGKVSFPGMVTDIVSLDECVSKYIGNPDKRGQLKVLIDPSL
ncbi:MAG: zinc-binding dehydrogenase, partial [Bradyrhizobium sp.]